MDIYNHNDPNDSNDLNGHIWSCAIMVTDDLDFHGGDVDVVGLDDELVEEKRGFKPSDVHDPGKREFLTQLRKSTDQTKSYLSNAQMKKISLTRGLESFAPSPYGHLHN